MTDGRRTIYIVTDGAYSSYRVLIAYDREEDAKAAVEAGVGDDYTELPVLSPGELPKRVAVHHVDINTRTGEPYHYTRDGWDFERHPDFEDWSWRPGYPAFRGVDKDRVLKAAQDHAARLRAEK
ncbi:hypothetical protein ABT336_13195 [Micromonospora sp. NPDC000207]|uniref:hypothetical protein n=1 Tax=Micromonospora sp. NPDC000207 TaxID=3154246 RepID=UPI0033223527